MLLAEKEFGRCLFFVSFFYPHPHNSGTPNPSHPFKQRIELRICRVHPRPSSETILYPVYSVYTETENKINGKNRFEPCCEVKGGNGIHQFLGKFISRHGTVCYGGTVKVPSDSTHTEDISSVVRSLRDNAAIFLTQSFQNFLC